MKARLINNFFAGAYKDDWLLKNQDRVVNGVLVSEWVLIDTLPVDGQFIKPLWNGSAYEEGASTEERTTDEKQKKTIEDSADNAMNLETAAAVITQYNERMIRLGKDGTLGAGDLKTLRKRVQPVYEALLFGWIDVAKDEALGVATGGGAALGAESTYFKNLIASL